MDVKLEMIALPVSNVDRPKQFYEKLGWRMDIDYVLWENTRIPSTLRRLFR